MANETQATEISVEDYLASVTPANKQADARELLSVFKAATGFAPKMWGPTIIGFGRYDYRYESGREGSSLATGFAPRKAAFSVYIMPGYADFSHILNRIGKHKIGKSCLYFNKLADIDTDVLTELIKAGLANLETYWPVSPA